jgi:hypothetical protein
MGHKLILVITMPFQSQPKNSNTIGQILISKVSDLINPIDFTWDEELIRTLFWPIGESRVPDIPLLDGREDFIAWHRTIQHTVRSAYHAQWPMGTQV